MTETTHKTTTIIGPNGTYWLTGSRGWDFTARFDLAHDNDARACPTFTPVIVNADWPTTWTALHKIMKHDRVEAAMRSVLPPVDYR